MSKYTEILSAALNLAPHERGELAEVLWESTDEPIETARQSSEISAAWKDEIARRSAAYVRGELKGIPWSQVREEIRRKYQANA
jgi:putative addiction module component (TIGR02574 family)